MKISPRTILAAALLTALPMGSALACTTGAWTSATAGATAGSPADGTARYSGSCGLSAAAGGYVVDNTPGAETTYRARFYVLTGSGDATIFKATSADDGGGNDVIKVEKAGTTFTFEQNGNPAGTVNGIVSGAWYSIEVAYTANGTFSADVAGNQTFIGNVAPAAAGAGTIASAVLGVSDGAGGYGFDAFVSTRGDSAIGRLCRGDVDGDGELATFDRTALNTEILSFGATLASGQPDCNEDGAVDTFDRTCLNSRILNFDICS